MAKPSLREPLLQAGLQVMFHDGYVGASVRDITVAAGAPLGSFTNHFSSKEAFAAEVLARYFDYVKGLVRQALDDASLPPRDRLRRYLDLITDKLAADGCTRGCLIGDFSLETPGHSALLREQLAGIFGEWRDLFARCIADAQAAGEIATDFPPDELAEFLLASWQGAILRMKVERSTAALERFKRIAFATVFSGGQHERTA
ncbi:transcriptional regulator, TetR family [Andreprevotia lacus DSM 23236]|jgi:TetR/AcrR family transcriptional repressor of nem operon|uniref:Transcriptional regulator, TetR family n=1 Tax=Andreprevotia lacus DSM 23236 TaxID=1121001 RepID=A0A1W1X903_9NEIS|nr:TetR family transcriptional regulator C-terminal domain-containing protein [Andreprevotia lacus]SMC20304.1 transcriptional regulator, TetR family [Andreprevotia lacus DSM 23236]